jgi:thiosulfate oxidation carrier protein SoxY/thiosulfate oxidation carrier complex protein SoxZ
MERARAIKAESTRHDAALPYKINPPELHMLLQRRQFIANGSLLLGLIAGAGAFAVPSARAASADRAAFAAARLDDAFRTLGAGQPTTSRDIQINGPDVAEDGAVVPITVSANLPGVQSIAILVEKNRTALTAQFTLPEGTASFINTRIKMSEASRVIALVRTPAGFFMNAREIRVTQGGCGPGDPVRAAAGDGPAATRIRASVSGGETEIKALMSHDMETGQRRDANGALIPAHHITDLSVTHNGRVVLAAQFGTAISRNPFLQFRFKGGTRGDKVNLNWTDNRGLRRSDETVIG